MSKEVQEKPVIIIGAGVIGLTLAHGLQKNGIPFNVYERDDHIDARGQGWAITLHWGLPYLRQLVDATTIAAVDNTQVDPDVAKNDTGNFLFLNLKTLETKFRIPPNDRRRVNREKMRKALLEGVKDRVHWGMRLKDIEPTQDGVQASFANGEVVQGRILVGAEGSSSRTRQFLTPTAFQNQRLPVRFLGVAVDMTPEQTKPLRAIDPLLFQGCHPDTGNYIWVSMLETPATNGTEGTAHERFRLQINISWPVKGPADEVPPTNAERLVEMKRRAKDFHPVLRSAVDLIAPSTEVVEVVLQDWPCLPWDNYKGRVTLAGDAAHAMTMYRGEAGNHGILDAYHLSKALAGVYRGEFDPEEAVDRYEAEMRERTHAAVLLSRQACLDAHDFHGLNEHSAVLKRRAIVAS